MTALDLFTRLLAILDLLRIPYQAFEDYSIRLLAPAPLWLHLLIDRLHTING
jgi:hypothetical protein